MTHSDPILPPDDRDAAPASDLRQSLPLTRSVEAMTAFATTQMHLFGTYLGMVRNFHRTASMPWSSDQDVRVARVEERQSVVEIERDGRVGIDLKFGSITFKTEDTGSYAVALVDVIVSGSGATDTRVQMEIKVPADPGIDTVLGVTEKCRVHIVTNLRAAADMFDATSARALLFHHDVAS